MSGSQHTSSNLKSTDNGLHRRTITLAFARRHTLSLLSEHPMSRVTPIRCEHMLPARLPPHAALFTRLSRIGSSVARIHKSTRNSVYVDNRSTKNLGHLRFLTMTKPRQLPVDGISQENGYKKVLTMDTINSAVVKAEYAVRGELALRANALEAHLNKHGKGDLPFGDIVHCEIGNPQALDQKPLSFIRQVLTSGNERLTVGSCAHGIS